MKVDTLIPETPLPLNMRACARCRRVESVSPMMVERLSVDMVGVRLPVPSGFGRLIDWHDGPCALVGCE